MRWSAWHCRLRLTQPLPLKRGTLTERDILLLKYSDGDTTLWGEVAPLPGWSEDSFHDNLTAVQALDQVWSPQQALHKRAWPAALSTALAMMPLAPAAPVISNALAFTEQDALGSTAKTIKLKVGQLSVVDTAQQVNVICEQLWDDQRLRLDANQCWNYDEVEQLSALLNRPEKIEYIEEPLLPSLDYRDWQHHSPLSFAYDERLLNDEPKNFPGLSTLIVKPTLLGWKRCEQLHLRAEKEHLQLVLSSSFESPLLLGQLNRLARNWHLRCDQGLATSGHIDSELSNRDWPLTRLNVLKRVLP